MLLLPIHIIAGLTGIASGFVALYTLKGAQLHRKSGLIFVYAMLIVSITGAVMGALLSEMAAVIPGVLTFYLVMTALRTVRRPVLKFHWMDLGFMLLALLLGMASISYGFVAEGQPTGLYVIFGTVALLAALGDIRMMLSRGICGACVLPYSLPPARSSQASRTSSRSSCAITLCWRASHSHNGIDASNNSFQLIFLLRGLPLDQSDRRQPHCSPA